MIEAGQTVDSDISTDVDAVYSEVYAWLSERDAVTWDSDESIPDEAVRPVVSILAAEIADDYINDENRYMRLQIEAYGTDWQKKRTGGAVARLVQMAAGEYIPQQITSDYY